LCVLNRQTQTVHGKGQLAESKDQHRPKQSMGRASVLSLRTNVLICVQMDSHGLPVSTDVLCVLMDSHRQPRTSSVCWRTPTDVLCVLNTQPTWAKITQTVHGKGQRAEASVLSPKTNVLICTATDVLCVLTDTQGRPVCADGHPRTSCVTDVLCVLNRQPTWAKITQTVHGKGQHAESKDQRADMCTDRQPRTSCLQGGPKSPEQSTGRASMLSLRTSALICLLMDSHRCLVCADIHTRTHADSHRRPVCAGGHPRPQPMWAKIIRTVHGKGQHAESKNQRADMFTDGQPRTDVLCVLTDKHR
ncbi:unnamed protein product, partial [Brassica rapa]